MCLSLRDCSVSLVTLTVHNCMHHHMASNTLGSASTVESRCTRPTRVCSMLPCRSRGRRWWRTSTRSSQHRYVSSGCTHSVSGPGNGRLSPNKLALHRRILPPGHSPEYHTVQALADASTAAPDYVCSLCALWQLKPQSRLAQWLQSAAHRPSAQAPGHMKQGFHHMFMRWVSMCR